jgi:hypothetical protein
LLTFVACAATKIRHHVAFLGIKRFPARQGCLGEPPVANGPSNPAFERF